MNLVYPYTTIDLFSCMEQLSFLEKLAELLAQRIELGKGQLPVPLENKQHWYDFFEEFWPEGEQERDEVATRRDSGANYMLAHQLIQIWERLDTSNPKAGMALYYALDAFFDFMELKLLEAEKINAGKRILVQTRSGTLMLGGRPLLADMSLDDERIPLDAKRLYRRVSLLPGVAIDQTRELVDGEQYRYSVYKLSRPQVAIGLAPLSGVAVTHFKSTGQLAHTGSQPQIAFESERMLPADDYANELRACIDWAVAERIQILCLPELSVCANGRQVLKAQIQQYAQARQLKDLALVIAGSYHHGNHNETPVWLVDSDGAISEFKYRKHESFATRLKSNEPAQPGMEAIKDFAEQQGLLEKEYYHIRENIISNEDVLMLQLPIGLVGILICKDFLSDSFYARYDTLEPDYLFIVSMNSKGGEFEQAWRTGAKRHALSAGFYVNATQVVAPTDSQTEVVFWGLPDDHSGLSERKSEVYYRRVKESTPDQPFRSVTGLTPKPLPTTGLVQILLASNHFNYETNALNLIE